MLGFTVSAWLFGAVIMSAMWGIYTQIRNAGIVDVGWTLVIFFAGFIAYNWHSGTGFLQVLAFTLLFIWALRLGGFLAITRVLKNKQDPRYEEIKNSFNANEQINFFLNYQLQAFLAAIVASCLYYVFQPIKGSFLIYIIGMILVILGIICESIADQQLYSHKASGNKSLCKSGFWKHSRHPNLFFELVIWTGFGIMGFGAKLNILAFLSPIALWAIMKYLTVPLSERVSAQRREEYSDYVKETNEFIPFDLKKGFRNN